MDLSQIANQEQLAALIQKGNEREEIDPHNLTYAIYLRKSSEEDTKQVTSIEDQLVECLKLTDELGITINKENIIEERGSAKKSGIRPNFDKLLARIQGKEIDGIISWHPDRLSRNMLEAGKIIDMLDSFELKDLRFVSHPFTNDPAGKMLLGILFVMAKQYSEKLSIDIKRKNKLMTLSGQRLGTPPHGYKKDNNDRLVPDGKNYAIISEAFRMRLAGETQGKIADYINQSGYMSRGKDDTEKKIKFGISGVSRMMSDSVYVGVMKQGDYTVVLADHYDFVPILTMEEYKALNKYSSTDQVFKTKKAKRSEENLEADFLPRSVFCDECGGLRQAGASKSKTGKKYYYFRCKSKECPQTNTRARVIIDFVIDYLSQKPFNSQEAYGSYEKEIIRIQRESVKDLVSIENGAKRKLGIYLEKVEDMQSKLANETDKAIQALQKDELKRLRRGEKEARDTIKDVAIKKAKVAEAPRTYEQFIKIMEEIADKIDKVQSTTALHHLIDPIFLNFSTDAKNVVNYTLKSPFDRLESKKFAKCGHSR